MATVAPTTAQTTGLNKLRLWLPAAQGVYFAVLGIWPIIDIHSFQAVTGPKTDHLPTGDHDDHWLDLTVGALITSIGMALLAACYKGRLTLETVVLGIASAFALAAVDITFVLRQVIAPIYLADAAVEVAFVFAWIAVMYINRTPS